MTRLSRLDIDGDEGLKKLVNDFQSLYINSRARKTTAEWAISGSRIALLIRCLGANCTDPVLFMATGLSALVRFEHIPDARRRGQIANRFQEEFTTRFAPSRAEAKVLKGKRPERIFWALFSLENHTEIAAWIEKFTKANT
jgi:hypothetical protein